MLTRIEGESALESERAVPRATRFIDGLVTVGEPNRCWGPLMSIVAWRLVVIEHYSRAPGFTAMTRALAK